MMAAYLRNAAQYGAVKLPDPKYWLKKVTTSFAKKQLVMPVGKKLFQLAVKPSTVKGAANLMKMAGLNKGTTQAIGKSLRAFGKSTGGKLLGSGLASGLVELGWRGIVERKPIFTKATAFRVGSAVVKGAISGAIAGAITGAVCGAGVGAIPGFFIGLGVGVGVSVVTDIAAHPAEEAVMKKMGINEDD